jgi:DNA-binding response OmpR family regulator
MMAVSVETSKTILLLFNDPARITVFRMILETKLILTILEASDVKTAQVMISDKWPDLIMLSDWIGSESGIDFVRLLRSQQAFEKIRIIMHIVDDHEKADEAKNAGVDVVIKIPIDRRKLISTVQALIGLT